MKEKRTITAILLLILTFSPSSFIYSTGGGGGGGKKDPPADDRCLSIQEQNASVTLFFPFSYTGRTFAVIPNNNSDPNLVTGGNSLFNSSSTFYCVVTIVGGSCTNYNKTYVWNVKSRTQNIPVPKGLDYQLSVEFYESCGGWDTNSSSSGRPFYAYSRYFTSVQASYSIDLRYTRTENC